MTGSDDLGSEEAGEHAACGEVCADDYFSAVGTDLYHFAVGSLWAT